MRLARVVGTVTATVRAPGFEGRALLMVATEGAEAPPEVAVDACGAGVGDLVLVTAGSAARMAPGAAGAPTDLAVVAVVDAATLAPGMGAEAGAAATLADEGTGRAAAPARGRRKA